MKCPFCTATDFAWTDGRGFGIDSCPPCRGIWLDRGELDRLIERAEHTEAAPRSAPQPPPAYPPREQHGYPPQHGTYGHAGHPGHYRKKPKSLLGELFDF